MQPRHARPLTSMQLQTTTILPLLALLVAAASAGPAAAHLVGPATRTGITPGLVEDPGAFVAGGAFCQAVSTAAPLLCGVSGVGAFFNVAAIDDPGTGHYHPFATGTCQVTPGLALLGPNYIFACATDRNDDGLVTDQEVCAAEDDTTPHAPSGVTNHDECSGETAVTNGGVNENWADDWVYGDQGTGAKSLCFQDDVRGFTPSLLDDLGAVGSDVHALNQAVDTSAGAASGWDEVIVFVGVKLPGGLTSHVGTFTATLAIAGAAGCGGGNVSGHTTAGNVRTFDNASSLHDGDCRLGFCASGLLDL